MVKVYGVRLLDDLRFMEMRSLLQVILPKDVCKTASKIKFPAGIQRKVLGELLLRAISYHYYQAHPDTIKIGFSAKNKPHLLSHPHIHFNISHSGEWVVIAFSTQSVGIDVEKTRPINMEIARRFYSEEENKRLFELTQKKQLDYFFDLWTLKESFLKAIGTGLTKPLKSFTVQHSGKDFCIDDSKLKQMARLKQIKLHRDYKLSVCSFDEEIDDSISVLFINDLLEMLQN